MINAPLSGMEVDAVLRNDPWLDGGITGVAGGPCMQRRGPSLLLFARCTRGTCREAVQECTTGCTSRREWRRAPPCQCYVIAHTMVATVM